MVQFITIGKYKYDTSTVRILLYWGYVWGNTEYMQIYIYYNLYVYIYINWNMCENKHPS
jgi:hypothetical protein